LKQAVLLLYNEEFATQAISVMKEKCKLLIKRYFEDRSEDSFYSDLISMYKGLDSQDTDRYRLRKSRYISFLHKIALDQNQYQTTIMNSLKTIFDRLHRTIILLKSQKLKSSGIDGRSEFDDLFNSASSEFASVIAGAIENISLNQYIHAAALAGVCTATLVGAKVIGPFVIGVGAGFAAGCIGWTASWSRLSIWKFIAEVCINIILNHHSFKEYLNRLEEVLKSSKLFSV
jgi:hypothetical protein